MVTIQQIFVMSLHNIHSHQTRSSDINFRANQNVSPVHKRFLVLQDFTYWNFLPKNITSIKSFTKSKCDVFKFLSNKYA